MTVHTILNKKRYSFTDKDTGRLIEGMKLTYIAPCPESKDFKGHNSFTVPAPQELWDSIPVVPAQYDIQFGQTMGAGGAPKLTVTEVKKA